MYYSNLLIFSAKTDLTDSERWWRVKGNKKEEKSDKWKGNELLII